MIDLQLIDKGQHYKKLNRSYIIFICPFDAYGKGRHIYTFENICKEDNSISRQYDTAKAAGKVFVDQRGITEVFEMLICWPKAEHIKCFALCVFANV